MQGKPPSRACLKLLMLNLARPAAEIKVGCMPWVLIKGRAQTGGRLPVASQVIPVGQRVQLERQGAVLGWIRHSQGQPAMEGAKVTQTCLPLVAAGAPSALKEGTEQAEATAGAGSSLTSHSCNFPALLSSSSGCGAALAPRTFQNYCPTMCWGINVLVPHDNSKVRAVSYVPDMIVPWQ